MHKFLGWIIILTVWSPAVSAAESLTSRQGKDQAITIETEPPGALIWVREKFGTSFRGRAPVTLKAEYDKLVHKRDCNHLIDPRVGDWSMGLIIGVAATVRRDRKYQECRSEPGFKTTETGRYQILAAMDGYHLGQQFVEVPAPESKILIVLMPRRDANRKAEIPPKRLTGTDAVERRSDIDPMLRVETIRSLDGLLPKAFLQSMTSQLKSTLLHHGFSPVIHLDRSPTLVLDASLSKVDDSCQLRSTLFSPNPPRRLGRAMVEGACDPDSIEEMLEQLSRQIEASPGL